MKISWIEVKDLGTAVLGLPDDADFGDVEQGLFDEFEISFDSFEMIVNKLAPMTPGAISPLTGDVFSGFVKDGAFIVKVPCVAPQKNG